MFNFKYLAITLLSSLLSVSAYASESGQYQIDNMHSQVGFEVSHLVISTIEGKFTDFKGTIKLNERDFKKSKVTATINTQSIDTGVKKRDDHLKSKDFFQVSKYPIMKFKSHKITGNKSKFKITGDLVIKGITKQVTFSGKYLGSVKDGYGNLKTAFTAEAEINRKDFGLNWNSIVEAGPVVGDKVKIILKIQAAKPLANK